MRLPFHNNLSADDSDRVVDSLVGALTAGVSMHRRRRSHGSQSIDQPGYWWYRGPDRPAARRAG